MIDLSSRFRVAVGLALIAGTTLLAGCGSKPYSHSTTSEQTTTTTPAPQATTTTTTTEQNSQRP
jgi:hypothetical protein